MSIISSRLLLAVFFLLLIEYYSFTAVRTAARKITGRKKTFIFAFYVLLTALCWILVFSFRSMGYEQWPDAAKTLLIAGMMGFLLAKVLMALFMLADDVRRGVQWLFRKVWQPRRPVETTDILTKTRPAATELSGKAGPDPAGGGRSPAAGDSAQTEPRAKPGKSETSDYPTSLGKLPLPKITRSAFISKSAILAGGVAFGGMLLGTKNKYNYKIRRQRVPIKNLPAGLQGLKIVQISDIHCGSFDDREEVARGVQMVLDQEPDLIVITGDLVNNRADEVLPYQDIFARLQAPLGVYSVLGNHDYGHYIKWDTDADRVADVELLKTYQEQMGWKLLLNEHVALEHQGSRLHLIGVENWSAKPQFPQYGDLSKACAGIDWGFSDVNILLTHDPSHWKAEVVPHYKQIDLCLSGHTHGMQFGVRIPGFQWSPVQYVYKEWLGLYQRPDQFLYVNAGYGFLGYRGRLGIMPEITVLELTG